MIINSIHKQPSFVLAARMAGSLYRMLETARVMNISSSNAKGISIRGGQKTAGFKPITDFISETAHDTITISSKINAAALAFSISAVNEKRIRFSLDCFNKALSRLEEGSAREALQQKINSLSGVLQQMKQQQSKYSKDLTSFFDEITQRIRGAKIIVIYSRTEASRADEYSQNLFAIADDLEACSENIANEIKICKTFLYDLDNQIEQ